MDTEKLRTRSLATCSNPASPEVKERKSAGSRGRRASVAAAAKVRERIVKLIADVEAQDSAACQAVNDVLDARRGKTALHFCAERDEFAAVASLLAVPAIDANARRTDGATALFSAAMHGSYDCVRLLLDSINVDVNAARTLDGTTPLCIAAQQGHVDVVGLLLHQPGIKLNLSSNNGCSPLFIAAYKSRVKVVQMLLQCKNRGGFDGVLDVNKVEADGCSPLWIAADRGHTKIVEAIVCGPAAARVDVNRCDRVGRTPLFMAAFRGHADIVRMLFEFDGGVGCGDSVDGGAAQMVDPNMARSTDGATPLYAASMLGYTDVVKTMLAFGNPPRDLFLNLPNHDGATPLGTALAHGHEGIAAILRRAGATEPVPGDEHPQKDRWDTRELGILALGAGSTRTFKTPSMMESDAEDMCQCTVQ